MFYIVKKIYPRSSLPLLDICDMNIVFQVANSITDLGFPCSVIDGETGAGVLELEVRQTFSRMSRLGAARGLDMRFSLVDPV